MSYGSTLDFRRVTALQRERRLELRAEMRLPGEATLTFELEPNEAGCHLVQTARFKPRWLAGMAYWYRVAPFHRLVVQGMLQGIRRQAEAQPAR